jgi:hypothetical protein
MTVHNGHCRASFYTQKLWHILCKNSDIYLNMKLPEDMTKNLVKEMIHYFGLERILVIFIYNSLKYNSPQISKTFLILCTYYTNKIIKTLKMNVNLRKHIPILNFQSWFRRKYFHKCYTFIQSAMKNTYSTINLSNMNSLW